MERMLTIFRVHSFNGNISVHFQAQKYYCKPKRKMSCMKHFKICIHNVCRGNNLYECRTESKYSDKAYQLLVNGPRSEVELVLPSCPALEIHRKQLCNEPIYIIFNYYCET